MTDDNQPIQDEDAELLEELRALTARVDPPPERVVSAAKASFTWRTIDSELAELAELTFDSVVEDQELAGVRGEAGPRLLTFEAPEVAIELEVTTDDHRRRVVGQVVPQQSGAIEIRHAGGVVAAEADELGRFTADGVEPGPVSLRFTRAQDSGAVTTEWVAF